MSHSDIPTETIVGVGMLLLGVPYLFRNHLRRLRLERFTSRPDDQHTRPNDVLQLVERTTCPKARGHLIAALNCLLESPDAAID